MPLVVPIILAAVANLILARWLIRGPDSLIQQFGVGVLAGQFGLIAIWAVLGPWRLYAQWLAAMLVWLGLLLVYAMGAAIVEGDSFATWNEFLEVILGYSAALVAAQVPLWCIRLLRGWRLVFRGADAGRTAIESRQLQIRDILIAMTILAATLGTMSFVAKQGKGRFHADYLMEVVMVCGFAVVWSTLVLPICLWACFAARSLVVRILALIGYVTTLAIIALGVVAALAIKGVYINPNDLSLSFILVTHTALLATLFSGLGLARACGYVLVSVQTTRRHGSASR